MRFYLSLLCCSFACVAAAQPSLLAGYAIALGPDGHIFVGGTTGGSLHRELHRGGQDAFLLKLTTTGEIVWTLQFGTDGHDVIHAMTFDTSGFLYLSGSTTGSMVSDASGGAFIAKLTVSGETVWLRQFGHGPGDQAYAIQLGPRDEVYVAGALATDRVVQNSHLEGRFPAYDAFLGAFDTEGHQLWLRSMQWDATQSATDLMVENDGSIVVVGPAGQAVSSAIRLAQDCGFIQRLDASGEPMGPPSKFTQTRMLRFGYLLAHAVDGTFFVAGTNFHGHGSHETCTICPQQRFPMDTLAVFDGLIGRFQQDLRPRWSDDSGERAGYVTRGLALDPQGRPVVVGDAAIAPMSGTSGRKGRNGDSIIYGTGYSGLGRESVGYTDVFVVKYDSDGTFLWEQRFESDAQAQDAARGVAIGDDGTIYVTGYLLRTYDEVYTHDLAPGGRQAFIAAYHEDGRQLWINTLENEPREP